MHYIVLDRLSRADSYLHRIDGRFKIAALLVTLIIVSTTTHLSGVCAGGYLALLMLAVALSRLPAIWLLQRACTVLPFTAMFAGIAWWTQGSEHALALLAKSYLSALAVLLVVATTPMPELLDSAARLGLPALLVTVIQFLYRYLFLIVDQAHRMWSAARLRGAGRGQVPLRERASAAAGSLAVLFARSMLKAERIHMSMISRGFQGNMPLRAARRAGWNDFAFLACAAAGFAATRLAAGSLR